MRVKGFTAGLEKNNLAAILPGIPRKYSIVECSEQPQLPNKFTTFLIVTLTTSADTWGWCIFCILRSRNRFPPLFPFFCPPDSFLFLHMHGIHVGTCRGDHLSKRWCSAYIFLLQLNCVRIYGRFLSHFFVMQR